MDITSVIATSTLFCTLMLLFVAYAAVGNVFIGGHSISNFKDLNPFKAKYQIRGGRNKTSLVLGLWHLLFAVLLLAFSKHIISLRNSFKMWLDRKLGRSATSETTASSHSLNQSRAIEPSTSKSTESTSSVKSQASTSNLKPRKSRSRSRTPESVVRKQKPPNVMRSTLVDPEKQLIPPLPRLSIKEDTSDKLNKLIQKIDNLETTETEVKKND